MTIIIPYRDEVHKGLELRYALRSIEKYLTGYSRIIIYGPLPKWVNELTPDKSRYIILHEDGIKDLPARKEYNIYQKILSACDERDPTITDNFIMWNDDHFLLKPLHVNDIKYWHNGLLRDDLNRNTTARYRNDINNTLSLLSGILGKKDFLNYDIHCPIVYNKYHFKSMFKDFVSELCIKSYYANLLPVKSEFMEDLKIDGWVEKGRIKSLIADRLFMSSGTSLCTPLVELLGELFPEKSKFEL